MRVDLQVLVCSLFLGCRDWLQMSKSFERDERLSSDSKGRGRKLLASLLAQIRLQLAALAPAMNGFDGASQVHLLLPSDLASSRLHGCAAECC